MHRTTVAGKPINVLLLIMLCCSLCSCGTLQITFEKPSSDASDDLAASSTESAFLDLPTPPKRELHASETPIIVTPMNTYAAEATPSPTSASSNLKPITIDFIHMADEANGWAFAHRTVGDDTYRTILYSQDGGHTWHDMNEPGEGSDLLTEWAIGFFLDANTGWTVDDYDIEASSSSHQAQFLRWFNRSACETEQISASGTTSVEDGLSASSTPFLDFVDCDHGWFLFSAFAGAGHHVHRLYRSTDGGITWLPLIPLTESLCRKTGLDFIDEKNGWITTSCPFDPGNVVLEKTEDGGSSWLSIHLPPPGNSPNAFTDALNCETSFPTLFSAKSGSLIVRCYFQDSTETFLYATHDGTQTWSISPFPGNSPLFINQDAGWALGKEIYQTLDGGQTWTKMSTVEWDGQFSFVSDRLGWAVARSGEETALVHSSDGGRTWEMMEANVILP
jgi:photosystem II stability/assembly factor-like uncharacterized protein